MLVKAVTILLALGQPFLAMFRYTDL